MIGRIASAVVFAIARAIAYYIVFGILVPALLPQLTGIEVEELAPNYEARFIAFLCFVAAIDAGYAIFRKPFALATLRILETIAVVLFMYTAFGNGIVSVPRIEYDNYVVSASIDVSTLILAISIATLCSGAIEAIGMLHRAIEEEEQSF